MFGVGSGGRVREEKRRKEKKKKREFCGQRFWMVAPIVRRL